MLVDGSRLPAGIGKNRAVRHGPDRAMRCHQGERRRLYAGAER